MEYGELVYACALNRIFNYNCKWAKTLFDHFPIPSTPFSLSRKELCGVFGKQSHYVDDLLDKNFIEKGYQDTRWAERVGVNIIYIGDSIFPKRLKECPDSPIILFYKGNSDLNAERIISIVGTRSANEYGKECCRKIIRGLSSLEKKPIIVSGLAYGIDICAHICALEYGLDTIGVMATGLDDIYPRFHRDIANKMTTQGGIISDFPPNSTPIKINFLRRNRIIAGLSDATLLVQSNINGGGIITSKIANSYSREVFAIPGRITDESSLGCNMLIGNCIANIVNDEESILKTMNWENTNNKKVVTFTQIIFDSDDEITRNILLALSSQLTLDIDTLFEIVKGDYNDFITKITSLELDNRISSDVSGRYRAVL